MKCSEIRNDIYFYIKNELEPSMQIKVKEHIINCPSCQKLVKEFSETLETVDRNVITVPEKNRSLLIDRISEKIYQQHRFKVLKPAIAFALSLFIFVFGYQYYKLNQLRNGENGAEVAQDSAIFSETEELVAYLTDFDIPELYQ
ncbi:MAG: zf-HC2 domain-containing protein [Elusimicrobia bacterium]|nr:zf-HC2 domain-containing protein [Elusimicrobiota bacterium]